MACSARPTLMTAKWYAGDEMLSGVLALKR